MRLESLRIKGLGPFATEQFVDLSAIDGQIVAVAGRNGAGKSTFCELWGGSMYRSTQSRGKLATIATERGAYVEARVVNGAAYTLRQSVDGISGKAESLVLDAEGKAVLSDTKVTSFDEWAKSHLPQPDVFFASQFSAQKSGGLVSMNKSERKAVMLRAFGIEHLEKLAADAGERKRAVLTQRAALVGRIEDERKRGGDVGLLTEQLQLVNMNTEAAEREIADLEIEIAEARRLAENADALQRDYLAAVERRDGIKAKLATETEELASLELRLRNNQGLTKRAAEIREAVEIVSRLQGQLRGTHADLASAKGDVMAREAAVANGQTALTSAERRVRESQARIAQHEQALTGRAEIDAAVAKLPDLRAALEQLTADAATVAEQLEAARQAHVSDAGERIEGLRGTLLTIVEDDANGGQLAKMGLAEDDERAESIKAAPAKVLELSAALRAAQTAESKARQELATAQRLADRAEQLAAADAAIAAERETLDGEQAGVASQRASLAAAKLELEAAYERVRNLEGTARQIGIDLAAAEGEAKYAEPLARAEERIKEYEQQIIATGARIAGFEAELRDQPEPQRPPVAPAVPPLEARLKAHREALKDAQAQVARLDAAIAAAQESQARLAGLEQELADVDADVADWTRLSQDLGRDGLQAVEIDVAGPAVTDLTNQLLHEAFGSRFTVTFETTRRSSDGKRDLEDFQIMVLDTEKGREGPAEMLSGGELVIVSEALSLAFTLLSCRSNGVERPTLIRDECGAALDPENAPRYISMLRRAAKIVGADKILFISHDASIRALADATINIADGQITTVAA